MRVEALDLAERPQIGQRLAQGILVEADNTRAALELIDREASEGFSRAAGGQFVARAGEKITANATFATPGDYMLRVQANDESGEGGFGFQCCWTNTYVKVAVRP